MSAIRFPRPHVPFLFLPAVPCSARKIVVAGVDLTRLSAGNGKVTGGIGDKGWRCTGAKGERIVFDAGRTLANGYLEVSLTIDILPWKHQQCEINYAGLHEDARLNQSAHSGDLKYRFSHVKAAGRAEDSVADGKTVHTARFEWRDGVPIFSGPQGSTVIPRDIVGADTPIDRLRLRSLSHAELPA